MRDPTRLREPPLPAGELDFLLGGGEMGAMMRSHDWQSSPLGQPKHWPQSLRSALSICLNSGFQIAIYWGKDLSLIYNDAWSPILGQKHPEALGRPAFDVWPEIWETIGPMFESVYTTGEAIRSKDSLLAMHRHGFTEECYFDYTFSPIRDEQGKVGGIFNAVIETTFRVIGERRTRFLRDLTERLASVQSAAEAIDAAAQALSADPSDLPFVILDLPGGTTVGLPAGHPAAKGFWDVARACEERAPLVVEMLSSRFGAAIPDPCWPEPCERAMVLPLGDTPESGALIAGISPRLALDDEYRAFVTRVASVVAAAISRGHALEQERRRAQAIAELDRAKTVFFSNVSHEFRTPLTLMLGPLESALTSSELAVSAREDLALVHRNALRLLKLVNSLLDFSRIEAGRMQAAFEPTDLATFTRDVASTFRSAMEKAGLGFRVDCQPLREQIPVDRGMWEKIVLNLLSNAFKFTLTGSIEVSLREDDDAALLEVRDTGIGIEKSQLTRVFERFHRIENPAARTHEGTGIGLALVQELVQLHGGMVQVWSTPGQGSVFAVRIPFRSVEPGQGASLEAPAVATRSEAFVQEALRWLPDAMPMHPQDEPAPSQLMRATNGARVVVADDNSDMREYVRRLLEPYYSVTTTGDGMKALAAIRRLRPDLVISDVMMPNLDGYGLLTELRSDPATSGLPVILLSARAGEEAVVEGIGAGADDYLVKPFSSRELLARVSGTLALARLRRELADRLRESDERFRAVQDSSPDGFMVYEPVRDESGAIVDFTWSYLNMAAARLAGKESPEFFRGRRLLEMFPGQLPTGLFERYLHVIGTGEPWIGEVHYHRDGVNLLVRLAVARVGNGVAVSIVDISERYRAEQALKLADRQKDEFLAMLAHELRNPLAPIRTASELLSRMKGANPQERNVIEIVRRQSTHLSRLVDDLLDVSRITQGRIELRRETLLLADVIRQAVEGVEPIVRERRHDLRIRSSYLPLYVHGDFARLVQCLVNLLTNSAKYTDPGGIIDVSLQEIEGVAVIEIKDNGIGIAPELLPRIFDLFVQSARSLDRSQGGLGIGLSVVQRLVQMHGGKVEAHSEGSMRGSTFIVRLPLTEAPPANKVVAVSAPVVGKRILIVDDNEDAAETLAMMLSLDGHEARTAFDGPVALSKVRDWVPDIVLLDIGLPGMDGYQVAQELRNDPSIGNIKLIALTGYGQPEDKIRAMNSGFDDHLVKPIAPELLADILR